MNYEVRVFPFKSDKGNTKAFASLVFIMSDDVKVEVKNFRVISGRNGMFVSAPSHAGKDKNGETTYYNDVLFQEPSPESEDGRPRKGDFQQAVERDMLAMYEKLTSGNARADNASAAASAPGPNNSKPNDLAFGMDRQW